MERTTHSERDAIHQEIGMFALQKQAAKISSIQKDESVPKIIKGTSGFIGFIDRCRIQMNSGDVKTAGFDGLFSWPKHSPGRNMLPVVTVSEKKLVNPVHQNHPVVSLPIIKHVWILYSNLKGEALEPSSDRFVYKPHEYYRLLG